MNQPHNPIRPRRRQPMVTAAQPVMARPEQSTRVLIRVPAVASVATEKKQSAAAPADSKPTLEKAVATAVVAAQPSAAPSAASKSHLRIDAGHLESLRPHLAETQKRSWNWWTDPSQRRAMIAVALIVGAVVVIAIMLHNESQHRTMQANDDRNVKVLRTEVKEPTPPQAASPWNGNGQNTIANRPTPANGFTSAGAGGPANQAPIGNPAIGSGPNMNTTQYRAADSQNSSSGAAQNYSGTVPNQSPWKTPAGSNMPARVDPINATQPPASGPSQQAAPETVYSAQRGSLPFGIGNNRGSDYRAVDSQQGAAFNGGINNPAMQISR